MGQGRNHVPQIDYSRRLETKRIRTAPDWTPTRSGQPQIQYQLDQDSRFDIG
jgi:hypothetical protein